MTLFSLCFALLLLYLSAVLYPPLLNSAPFFFGEGQKRISKRNFPAHHLFPYNSDGSRDMFSRMLQALSNTVLKTVLLLLLRGSKQTKDINTESYLSFDN